jgi:hypothetical protein
MYLHLSSRHYVGQKGQLPVTASTGYDPACAPDPEWTLCSKREFLVPAGKGTQATQPFARRYIDCAIPDSICGIYTCMCVCMYVMLTVGGKDSLCYCVERNV